MIVIDIILRLTCVIWVDIRQLFANVSPITNTKTRLTYLYIDILSNLCITPNGSLLKWCGYAQKWAHPP